MRVPAKAAIAGLVLLAGAIGIVQMWHGTASRPVQLRPAPPSAPIIVPITSSQSRPGAPSSPLSYVAAAVTARAPIVRARLFIDGRRVPYEMMGRDDSHQSVFSQPLHLAPGTHHVYLIAWDSAGRAGRRRWAFRAPPRHGNL